ncbi:MAG: penicillin-binding transpeptidase domain-containing protein [Actinomycetota bacterium]|nr:penicillin-binding transpeptidase domain-containing protein [Actinomycetota bacterium]
MLALVLAVAALGLTACSEERPGPEDALSLLVSGLSTFELAEVPFTAATAAQAEPDLAEAVAELGELRPSVELGDVDRDDENDTATAVLAYTWDLDDTEEDWSYETAATLAYDEADEAEPWRVAWSTDLVEPSLTPDEHLVLGELAAERADVLGAGGVVLVTDRDVLRIGIDKTQVAPAALEASATALAELLEIDVAGYVAQVTGAGEAAFVEALVVRAEASPVVGAELAAIEGAVALEDELPLAPTREFARPILGTVGEATAEIIEASGGEIAAGDTVGLSGLQARYDATLRGQPGLTVSAAPAEGTTGEPRTLYTRAAAPGEPLTTTLDPDLQQLAETVLAPVAEASAIVAIRPSTGEVLAAASGSGGGGLSTATIGQYAPGSTFKVVSTLALLRAGLTPESELDCTSRITVDGKEFENYDDYPSSDLGGIPLQTALASSCNTAFISARDQVPQDVLAESAAALGLGVDADLGLPAFFGSVPAAAETETEHAASMIGQGRVQASPLAMAAVAASVARGETVVPVVLLDAVPAEKIVAAPLQPVEAEQLRALLETVVDEGSARFLSDVPGDPVGAKTGTAEYGSESPPRTHAWMIAIQGDLAVAVFVEDGESGSRTAGPLLEAFLRGGV